MRSRERLVHFYDVTAITSLHGHEIVPPQMSIADALRFSKESWDNRVPGNFWRDGGRQISVDDWIYEPARREHYLVINCADPRLADVAFKNIVNGRTRMAGKHADEAIDLSAHLLIREQPHRPALMLLTNGAGVSAAKIASILANYCRQAADRNPAAFRRNHPNGVAGKYLKAHLQIEAKGHQSRTLQDIIQRGRIEGLELISEVRQQIDQDNGFQATAKTLHVEVVNNNRPMSIARLQRLIRGVGDVSKAKIQFRETNAAKSEVQTFEANALERAFVRKEQITFNVDIASRYTQVSQTIVDRLRALR